MKKKATEICFIVGLIILIVWAGRIYYSFPADIQANIRADLVKSIFALVAVSIISIVLKWYLTDYTKTRELAAERKAELNEFRRELIARLVNATNLVRTAPLQKKTYGEQMKSLCDVKSELSSVRHELESYKEAFSDSSRSDLRRHITEMEEYLRSLIEEWTKECPPFPGSQTEEWPPLDKIPMLMDLHKGSRCEPSTFYSKYIKSYRDALLLMRKSIWSDQ